MLRRATMGCIATLAFSSALQAQTLSMPDRLTPADPIPVAATGLPPRTEVTIAAERRIGKARFASRAVFLSGSDGAIDLATAQPIAGDYQGIDPAGLFWSMRPLSAGESNAATPLPADSVRLTLLIDGKPVTTRAATVAPDPQIVSEEVSGFPAARLYRHCGTQRRPVIIILGGSEGGSETGRTLGPQFAALGYAALALPYYSPGWTGREIPELSASFADIPVDRLEQVRDWIARRPDLDARRIGLYGVSKGGEFALLAASRFPWLRAVAAIVPSDVVWEGWGPDVKSPGTRSSFSWRGKPLPFMPYRDIDGLITDLSRGRISRLRLAHDEGRAAHPALEAFARIPVERFRGALLVAGGDADGTWASGPMARAMAARRARYGLRTTLLTFPDAGHGLSGTGWEPMNWPGADAAPGSTARARAEVRAATLALFAQALRVGK